MAFFEVDIAPWVQDFTQIVNGQRIVADASMIGGFDMVNHVRGDVTVSGIPEVMANWKTASDEIKAAALQQLRDARDMIKEQSQREVPFDTGQLQSAWFDNEVDFDGDKPIMEMGYDPNIAIGNDGGSYAWRQHEDLSLNHPTPGTKAKYLSDPFDDAAQKFPDDLRIAAQAKVATFNPAPRLRKKGS